MFDVITLGSATKDIFCKAERLKNGPSLILPLGRKVELSDVQIFAGGGGVNAALTFARQGLKTAFCGAVGQDLAGREILAELRRQNIDAGSVVTKSKAATDLGLIFHAGSERVILLFHSVSRLLSAKDIDWQKLKKTRWLYLAPLWGQAAKLTPKLISWAKRNGVKVALNPSPAQLQLAQISSLARQADVLLLNAEEAATFLKLKRYEEAQVSRQLAAWLKGKRRPIVVITKGRAGAVAFGQPFSYSVPAPATKVVDATGAGDSFGSGLVAGLIQGKNLESALRLAMANAVANIKVYGANQGLLKKGDPLPNLKITHRAWSA